MNEYKIGIIYQIFYNENPDIRYIGSTTSSLKKRKSGHKEQFKRWNNDKKVKEVSIYKYFKEFGFENFTFTEIKKYKIIDQKHLLVYETLWFNKLKCINKIIPFQPYWKYNIKLYEKTRIRPDNHKEYQQNYYKKNKEEYLQKMSEYREKNREKINKQKRESNAPYKFKKYYCKECNKEICFSGKNRHIKRIHY